MDKQCFDGRADEEPKFKLVKALKGHSRAIASCKFAPGSCNILATGSADKTARLWDPDTGLELRSFEGHGFGISDLSWSPKGNFLCTASDDHTLKLWDVETGKCLSTLAGHTNFVFCCSFSPHGNILASGSFDETLRVWDVRSGHCLREVPAHSDPITAVDFSADGTLIATSSLDGLCRVWDTQTGHCLKTLFDRDSPPMCYVRFTPNGQYILLSSLNGRMRLWDYEKSKAIKTYEGHINTQYCVVSTFCTPQGAPKAVPRSKVTGMEAVPWVVTGSEDGRIHVYGLNSQKVLQVLEAGTGQAAGNGGSMAAGSTAANLPAGPGDAPKPQGVAAAADTAGDDAVLCVDAHPCKPMLAACGRYRDGVVKLWEHRPQ